jgi:predicted dehydrogenase
MTRKTLAIGLVGCGFMGRTHSNAFRQVGRFFDPDYDLALKAVCARTLSDATAFAETWGYDSVETDWRVLVARRRQHGLVQLSPRSGGDARQAIDR